MKTNFLPLLALTSLLFAACASDNIDPGKQKNGQEVDTSGLTSFAFEEPRDTTTATRIVGEYTGTGVRFCWSKWDNLFVYNPDPKAGKEWIRDTRNNIDDLRRKDERPDGFDIGRTPRATFWFEGTYNKPEYRVCSFNSRYSTYTGKVFIGGDNYIGPVAVDPSWIVPTGDFSTGIARRQADGSYTFMLDHKASYITFRPYSTQKALNKWGGAELDYIEISADQAVCGEFDIKGDTIDLSSRPTDEQFKKSTCKGRPNYLLNIPSEVTPTSPHAIMVIAPGTYTNFTVRYWFPPRANGTSDGCVTKVYPRVTFTAGKNKVISQDIHTTAEYPANEYCMWDAKEHYWKGYEWNGPNPEQPDYDEPGKSDKNPKDKNDPRWCSEVAPYADPTGAAPAVAATRSCKDCPNINELLWYAKRGIIWEDGTEMYSVMDSPYRCKFWLRKLSAIAKSEGKTIEELKAKAPNGVDYTKSTRRADIESNTDPDLYIPSHINSNLLEGTKMEDYFLLPAMGLYGPSINDKFDAPGRLYGLGEMACYWSSTPVPGKPNMAYVLELENQSGLYDLIRVRAVDRRYGFCRMWPKDR